MVSENVFRPRRFKGVVLLIEGLGDGAYPDVSDPLANRMSIDVGGMTHKYGNRRFEKVIPRRTFETARPWRTGSVRAVRRVSHMSSLPFLQGFVAAGLRLRATQGQRVWLLCRCRL